MSETCCVYSFLKAAQGNWRNSIYIKCDRKDCPYRDARTDAGFLMAISGSGIPIIVPVTQLCKAIRAELEPMECCCSVSCQVFHNIYHSYVQWNVPSGNLCTLDTLVQAVTCPY